MTTDDQIFNDIYFQMHCLYNAKTELYDRTLTNVRSKYDPTAAHLSSSIKYLSDSNAKMTYALCVNEIEKVTQKPFDHALWREVARGYDRLSAQGWIDLYQYLSKKKFIAKRLCEWNAWAEHDN